MRTRYSGGRGSLCNEFHHALRLETLVLDLDTPRKDTAAAASFGEVVAAHGLGIAREAARQIGGGADHGASRGQAAARTLARRSGWRSKIAPRIAGPRSSAVGTKSRRRQAMISEVRPSALS